ncbi:hypothetical protein D3C72_1125760 [compost metagenome]
MPRYKVTCQASGECHRRPPCGACAVVEAGGVWCVNCGSHSSMLATGKTNRHSVEKRQPSTASPQDSPANGIAMADATPAAMLIVNT